VKRLPAPALVVVWLLGCGGAPEPPGPSTGPASARSQQDREAIDSPPTPPTTEQLCAEVVGLECDAHLRCCDREASRYPSRGECVELLQTLCAQDLSGSAYVDGRIGFDAVVYRERVSVMRAAAGSCDPGEGEQWAGIYTGTLGEGADCTPDVDAGDYSPLLACRPGLACVVGQDGVRRACGPRSPEGQACVEVDCTGGTYCAEPRSSRSPPVCRALEHSGTPCDAHGACEGGYCSESGECTPRNATVRFCDDLTYP